MKKGFHDFTRKYGAHHGHPNCRGSKVIAHALLYKLFEEKVLARSLQISNASNEYGTICTSRFGLPSARASIRLSVRKKMK